MDALPIQKNTGVRTRRVLIGTPSLGQVRIEWHNAVGGLVIPCNWSNSASTPIGFLVADAQNLLVQQTLTQGFDYLFLLEDDVVPPPDLFLKLAPYLDQDAVPIISGLYRLKGSREPLLYRGRGNGAFTDFKPGAKVWVDGVPTGCLLVHRKVLQAMTDMSEVYTVRSNGGTIQLPRVFETPRKAWTDQGTGGYQKLIGTSDLYFCDQVIERKILQTAGWPKVGARRYPFLADTSIDCGHIDRDSGVIF